MGTWNAGILANDAATDVYGFFEKQYNKQEFDIEIIMRNTHEKYGMLTKRNCVRPCIHFPFIEPGRDFWNYVNSIKPFLPFKFEEKVLRIVSANKKRTDNVWKKITPDIKMPSCADV